MIYKTSSQYTQGCFCISFSKFLSCICSLHLLIYISQFIYLHWQRNSRIEREHFHNILLIPGNNLGFVCVLPDRCQFKKGEKKKKRTIARDWLTVLSSKSSFNYFMKRTLDFINFCFQKLSILERVHSEVLTIFVLRIMYPNSELTFSWQEAFFPLALSAVGR